jgi:HSF-type DNA-binding
LGLSISRFTTQEYHDYADKNDEWVEQQRETSGIAALERTTGNTDKFPIRLSRMLEGVRESGHSSIVRWLPHGRAFKIYNKMSFVEHVLPVYFPAQTEYASFQRQLKIYGFVRLYCKGPDKHGYYHEFLLRSRPRLATLIPRQVGKGPAVRYVYDPDTAPYFHGMPWLPETAHHFEPAQPIANETVPDPMSQNATSTSSDSNGDDDMDLADILESSDDDVAQTGSHYEKSESVTGTPRGSKQADWVSFLENLDFDAESDT